LFIAFHTSRFINHIENNIYLAWLCAIAIEGMLISLAIMKTRIAKVLIVPLFIVSTFSASFSFVANNEDIINSIFKSKRAFELLQNDLNQTQEELKSLSHRYTTKTLQRERRIKDMMYQFINDKGGELVIAKAVIFLFLVMILQLCSLYTAASLKTFLEPETVSETSVSGTETVLETNTETGKTDTTKDIKSISESSETDQDGDEEETEVDTYQVIAKLKEMKKNMSLTELSERLVVPKSTLSKVLKYPEYQVSKSTLKRIKKNLLKSEMHIYK